jgi:hypothetical protein
MEVNVSRKLNNFQLCNEITDKRYEGKKTKKKIKKERKEQIDSYTK